MQTYPTGYAESHRIAEQIFREILPRHGMAVREEQIALCHEILDTLLIDIKNGAANRIAQYETGYRTPKAEIVEKIAKVLNVREETFYMPNDTIVDLIRTLIWYDWEHSLPFQDFGDSTQCFLLRIRLSCSHPAVKALLADWRIHRTAFENGRITSSDYLEWMLQWPPTLSAPDD